MMNPTHVAPDSEAPKQWLSDVADGRLEDDALARACRRWAEDDDARRSWHAYHLIGDVMRSDDLARPAQADAAFLLRLRQRLADEPVVLAPTAVPATAPAHAVSSHAAPSHAVSSRTAPSSPVAARRAGRRSLWLLPMSAAAGFVAVAGVLAVLQQAAPGGGFDAPQMAATPPAALNARATLASSDSRPRVAVGMISAPVERSQMLRDARIDDYLRAHREVMWGSPAALPGGAVRTVDFEALPQR